MATLGDSEIGKKMEALGMMPGMLIDLGKTTDAEIKKGLEKKKAVLILWGRRGEEPGVRRGGAEHLPRSGRAWDVLGGEGEQGAWKGRHGLARAAKEKGE